MKRNAWIAVDPNTLDQPHPEEIQGILVEVFFSPYDVPEGVRGRYDESLRRFVIDFSYLGGPEPTRPVDSVVPNVVLEIGATTRRLQRIRLNTDAREPCGGPMNRESLKNAVYNAIARLGEMPVRSRPPIGNREAVIQVLAQKADKLLESTSLAS